jgi:hypothetical protein
MSEKTKVVEPVAKEVAKTQDSKVAKVQKKKAPAKTQKPKAVKTEKEEKIVPEKDTDTYEDLGEVTLLVLDLSKSVKKPKKANIFTVDKYLVLLDTVLVSAIVVLAATAVTKLF